MRDARGIQLLEMVVAVALSGVFVVLLAGMLSQTLSLSTASQNQIIAGAVADQVVEQIQSGFLLPAPRSFPEQQITLRLQLDPAKEIYGTYNGGQSWNLTSGNQFQGNLTITNTSLSAEPTTYLVSVSYPVSGGNKSTNRIACYWNSGAQF